MRNLSRAQPGEESQRQRNLLLRRERRVRAGEEEPEPVVRDRDIRGSDLIGGIADPLSWRLAVLLSLQAGDHPQARLVAAQRIDAPPFGDGDEPGLG